MTRINNLFIYFIFVVILLSRNCYGYIFKDILLINTYYKSYASISDECQFLFEFLCLEDQAGDDCSSTSLSNGTYGSLKVFSFPNSRNTAIKISFNIPIGKHSTSLNNVFPINLECLVPDFSKVSIKSLTGYFSFPNSNHLGIDIYSIYEISGFEEDISVASSSFIVEGSNQKCSMNKLFSKNSKIFSLICSGYTPIQSFSALKLNIKLSSSRSKSFILTPSYPFDYVNLYDLITYPDLKYLNNINLLGYDEYPLVSFKLNTTFNKGIVFINYNGTIQTTQLYPIYSKDQSSTTYISPLKNVGFLTTYDFNYFSGLDLTRTKTQITSKVNQYVTKKIASVVLKVDSSYTNGYPIITSNFQFSKNKDLAPIKILINSLFPTTTKWPFGYSSLDNSNNYIYEFSTLVEKKDKNTAGTITLISKEGSLLSSGYTLLDSSFVYDINLSPKVYKIEKIYLKEDYYLVRLSINCGYGLNFIKTNSGLEMGYSSLISGDLNDGVYEFVFSLNINTFLVIYDQAGEYVNVGSGDIINLSDDGNTVERYISEDTIKFDLSKIKDVKWLYNEIDITNFRCYNVLYFNYSQDVSRNTLFRLLPYNSNQISNVENFNIEDSSIYDKNSFPSTWDNNLKLFKIPFYVEENQEAGEFQFYIISGGDILLSNLLDNQLIIKKTNMDKQGPIISGIEKIYQNSIITSISARDSIGWTIEIKDEINGFKEGYVVISGESDQSIYNTSFSLIDVLAGGNQFLGKYKFQVIVSYPCISQNYIISEIGLYDNANRLSYFSTFPKNEFLAVKNPFINYLNDTNINKIELQCTSDPITSLDITPPILLSFTHNQTLGFEVGTSSRVIRFDFKVSDPESGIKSDHRPIVYLNGKNNQILECVSNIVEILGKEGQYYCEIQVPFGFSYPSMIIFSLYGLINNNGLWSGFSTKALSAVEPSFFYVSTFFTKNDPQITSSSEITEAGGELWLYGRKIGRTIKAYVKYYDEPSLVALSPSLLFSTSVQILGIKATNKPFEIYVQADLMSSDMTTVFSNTITITPIVFGNNFIDCKGRGIPNIKGNNECICNNKWITVDSENQCSIPNHYISSSSQVSSITGGELLLYGWFGDLYNSPILYINNKYVPSTDFTILSDSTIKTTISSGTVGPVLVNYTQNDLPWSGTIYPYLTTQIECSIKCSTNGECDKTTGQCKCKSGFTGLDCLSPNNNNNNKTETSVENNGTTIIKNQDVGFLISIDSIVELDINGNAVSTLKLTNNWVFVNESNSITTFTQTFKNIDNSNLIIAPTALTLIIEEVKDKDKEFSFAGNQFTVTHGGFKLSLLISNWQYKNNLNTLSIEILSDLKINQSNDNCNNNNNNVIIETLSSSLSSSDNLNYLKVTKNSRSLYARFQDKMLADNRIATILTKLSPLSSNDTTNNNNNNNNNIKVILYLPRCEQCLIDPDFSLLITSDYRQECKDSKKWLIPVIVVASVVGASLLFISLFLIYKRSTFLKIQIYRVRKHLNNNNN